MDKNSGTCSKKSTRIMCNQTLSTSRLIGPKWRVMNESPSSLSWINEKADDLAQERANADGPVLADYRALG